MRKAVLVALAVVVSLGVPYAAGPASESRERATRTERGQGAPASERVGGPRGEAPGSRTDWPQFRGASGAGVADASTLPIEWSTTKNVAWVSEIPGRGWSSPIVWRDRVYLTAAINKGDFKEPATGIYGNEYVAELQKQGLPMEEIMRRVNARDIETTNEAVDTRYVVMALDAATGKVIWQHDAHEGKPFGGRHRKNTYASETPATDGERLYASFGGNVGLFCYSLDGKLLWKHD
jgi:outer membrane protein assembly factor BamB